MKEVHKLNKYPLHQMNGVTMNHALRGDFIRTCFAPFLRPWCLRDHWQCWLVTLSTERQQTGLRKTEKIKPEVGADEKKAQQGRLTLSFTQLKGSKSVPCVKLSFNEQGLLGHMSHKDFSSASGRVTFSHGGVVHLITRHPKNFPV